MAVILRYFTEIWAFEGQLRLSGWRLADTVCPQQKCSRGGMYRP